VFKRSRANYSLWPEQRPRRGRPLRFAIGSFVLGAVCATAYGTLFNFTGAATRPGLGAQRVVEPVPIVIAREPPAEAVVPLPPAKPAEIASRPSRARTAAAKVPLPLIGAPALRPPATTDGRGGDDGLGGEVRLTGPEPASDGVPRLLGGDREPSRKPPVQDAPAKKADTAAKTKGAEPTAVIPMPPVAPPKTVAVKASEPPPTSQAPAKEEPRREPKVTQAPAKEELRREPKVTQAPAKEEPRHAPKVTQAPAAKTEQAAPTEFRSEQRGIIVLAKRVEPTKLAGDDEVPARAPAARNERSRVTEPTATAEPATHRRGYVVLKKNRKRPARLARGDDAPTSKPVVRTSKPARMRAASGRKHRAKPHRAVVQKKRERPTRYAARSRPKRERTTRHATRRRQDQLGPMIARATQMLRVFAGSQGFALGGF